ncbi:MAG TPA: NifU family protein [Acidimicrobiia bacterium]|nr:NifU family protein [Acidimicrobiia bacterium]
MTGPVTEQERLARLAELEDVMALMRPAVQQDGGDLQVVSADPETGVVHVTLQGACSSCAISTATLEVGVKRILTDRVPWITEVIGDVDDTIDEAASVAMGRGAYVPKGVDAD